MDIDIEEVMSQIRIALLTCGEILLSAERADSMISEKAGHANFVTTYDKKVEEILKESLRKALPQAVFVGEEEEEYPDISKGYAFIVDPIDGTTNFIRDYQVSSISVGLTKDGKPYAGVIYNPYLDEMFWAYCGSGAFLNGRPIHVSSHSLENGLVLFGTAPYYTELREETFKLAYSCACRALDLRRSGSAAIDLANIAAGRAELYFELRLQPWDYAAGAVLVTEAGGKVTTIDGKDITLSAPCSVLATNGVAKL